MEIDGLEVVGRVVRGDQRGRTIGFPTANVAPAPGTPVPPLGVYAAFADGRPAAVSVGSRETFDDATPGVVIEVHVLDFDGDLYGREMRLSFVTRLRGEQRYDDVTELVAQIERDVEQVRAVAASLA